MRSPAFSTWRHEIASRKGDEGTSFMEQLQPARAEFALRGPNSALRLDAVHDI